MSEAKLKSVEEIRAGIKPGDRLFLRRTHGRIVAFFVSCVNRNGTLAGQALDVLKSGGLEEIKIVPIGTREGECWPSYEEIKASVGLDTLSTPT